MLGGASYRQLRAQFPARPGRPALYRAGRRRCGRTRQDDHRRGIARPQRASYRREPCDARPALPAFGRNPPRRPPAPDAIYGGADDRSGAACQRSEEHTSELQSLMRISYAVFCLKKKKNKTTNTIRELIINI